MPAPKGLGCEVLFVVFGVAFPSLCNLVDRLRLGSPRLKNRENYAVHMIQCMRKINTSIMMIKRNLVKPPSQSFQLNVQVDPFTFRRHDTLRGGAWHKFYYLGAKKIRGPTQFIFGNPPTDGLIRNTNPFHQDGIKYFLVKCLTDGLNAHQLGDQSFNTKLSKCIVFEILCDLGVNGKLNNILWVLSHHDPHYWYVNVAISNMMEALATLDNVLCSSPTVLYPSENAHMFLD